MKVYMKIFLAVLLISALIVGGTGAWLKYVMLADLGIETQENIVALPFVLKADPQLQYLVADRREQLRNPVQSTEPEETTPAETVPVIEETEPAQVPETTEAPTEPTVPVPAEPVDESWFDDVLFIGESRTKGLQMMGRLGDADYFCVGALSIYNLMVVESSDHDFPEQTLAGLLSYQDYGKVYIHMGINELGGVLNMENFEKQYRRVIAFLHEQLPDAYIILQAALSVSSDYSDRDVFRIESINALNDKIRELSQEEEYLRFSDVNSYFADEDGYLRRELTVDGCHLTAPGYQEWAQWLRQDAAALNIPDPQPEAIDAE